MGRKKPATGTNSGQILTPEQVRTARTALESEGKAPPAMPPVEAPRVPSDVAKTAAELAEIKTFSGKILTLESHPVTPAAVVMIQELLTQDGWKPDRDGVRRDQRLWDMFQARARNQKKQLGTAIAKEVYESRKALRAATVARFNRQKDEEAPLDGEDKAECAGCHRPFEPMVQNLVIDGEIQTYKFNGMEMPKLTGNFVKAKYADQKFVPTAICRDCLRQYKEANRGTDLDTNGYPFARCEELCRRLNTGEERQTERSANLKEIAERGAKRKPKGMWGGFPHIR